MSLLHSLVLFAHFVGAAALLGGWLATLNKPTVLRWQLIGAWVQLVSGVLLVGLLEMSDDAGPVNHTKIAVKLLVLIAILVAAVLGRRKATRGEDVSIGLAHGVGGLTLLNVAIAVFW